MNMVRQVTTFPVIEKTVGDGNWDSSRTTIDRVVIHTMVGTASQADARFNSQDRVSAHYGVLLDGSIWHWVDEDKTAYHAGEYSMNQRSIGIEHEDNGDFNGSRTDSLYATSAELVRDICLFYNIPIDRQHIIKHSEVIPTGCPDALDIDRIVREASVALVTISQAELDAIRARRDGEWNVISTTASKLGVEAVEDLPTTQNNIINKIQELQDFYSSHSTTPQPLPQPLPPTHGKLYNLLKQLFDFILNLLQ